MKKISFLLIICLLSFNLFADEGMWMLHLLKEKNSSKMKELGLKIETDDIYNPERPSIYNAVVMFGGICSAEMISDSGLVLTNHHCGYDYIQQHSTVEHNYLDDGFWAMSKKEELKNPGLAVSFLIKYEDITDTILKEVNDTMTETNRRITIEEITQRIVKRYTDSSEFYRASVESFFEGNRFFLIVYEEYKDVRLVGTPPNSIGKFGGDVDNWMWPRHTGDFSLFRVYCSPDGKPAEYSEKNIPYSPKKYFPISLKGVKEGDYSMVMGFPGSTDRYFTSSEVLETMNTINPNRIKLRGIKQDIMMEDMEKDENIYIKYASKYSTSSNYWKYSIGQNECLEKLDVLEEKKKIEKSFIEWYNKNKEDSIKYAQSLELIRLAIEKRRTYLNTLQYINETMFRSTEIIDLASSMYSIFETMISNPDDELLLNEAISNFKKDNVDYFKNYNIETDKKIARAMFETYYNDISQDFIPSIYNLIKEKYNFNYDKFIDDLFSKSIFSSEEKLTKFLQKPNLRKLKNDIAFKTAKSFLLVKSNVFQKIEILNEDYYKGTRLYMDGLMKMNKEYNFYPNANFTMRLTYGSVKGYTPKDAVTYDYYTTLDGIIEKKNQKSNDFKVEEKLIDLYNKKDYSQYAYNGKIPIAFITNNDITGGNSGSPTINANGELIGVAFDGNWESMSGDIRFEQKTQRCISVDIRYVLFIIDKFAGAGYLLNEMDIVK